jgi:hypothetical protein
MKFKRGDRVRKIKGSSWRGTVCGEYSTSLTPEGYAVESEREPGSVQIYPAAALEAVRVEKKESAPILAEPLPPPAAPYNGKTALFINDVCRLSGLSKTAVYAAIKGGKLRKRKCGTRTLVFVADFEEWLNTLPAR